MAAGLPTLCPCVCPTCVGEECPCRPGEGHHASCAPAPHDPQDCTARYPGAGAKTADQVSVDDIRDLAWWSQRKALKRTVARNLKRTAQDDPLHLRDGRGAAETAIAGARGLFTWLVDNERATRNPALRVKLPARQEQRPARSLDPAEVIEVYRVAVTTGRDPQLDRLSLRHQLVHAVRRLWIRTGNGPRALARGVH